MIQQPTAPHLRIVSDRVAEQANDAMSELGSMTIADLLGTYQDNKDESDALLIEALALSEAGPAEAQGPQAHSVWQRLEQAQRRLWLFSVLAHEAYGS